MKIFQEILNESLKSNSERIAIEKGEESLTFYDLSCISKKVTGLLLKENLGAQTLVGIQLTNQVELISAIIGVMNARCIFVPINPALPENRLLSMIDNLDLNYLIVSKKDSFSESRNSKPQLIHYCYEDIVAGDEGSCVDEAQYPDFHEEDSLYIYFTSGTTGQPKGIVGKNNSLLQFLQWEITEFGIDHTYRVSQLINPYFDAFLRDIFVPLLSGGTICIPPDEDDFLSPEKLVSWIDKQAISLIHCVPSLFRVINSGSLLPEKFSHLKYIMLSGEKIVPSELTDWYQTFNSRIELVNFYGATETTMIRSFYKIRPEDTKLVKIPIGVPISDTMLLVSRSNFEPSNDYIPGDLYILSDYTTKGYINQPELTHEKFLQCNVDGYKTIAFKTGDKARKLANGQIELMGREDRQIKLRGIRIEPEEIENVLFRSKLLQNALVISYKRNTVHESLIVFVIRNKEVHPGLNVKEELLAYMKAHLPEYMIPAGIVEVNEYPLLSNGKIDYATLLNTLTNNEIVEPENKIEEFLLAIWKEILGDYPISTEDNFHQIGGGSLTLTKLVSKIYKKFNVRISLKELFNYLTIKKQAEFIKKATKDIAFVIPKAIEKPAYRLSSAQERIYYNYLLNKESIAYNLPMVWKVEGEIDVKRIENAFRLLIERHESLRTAFVREKGSIFQVVKEKVDIKIQEIEISESIGDESAFFKRVVTSFDLGHAPLIRCLIATCRDNKKLLVLDLHHIICDGISQMNLLSDFLRLYKGEEVKPLTVQYKDYAEWEFNFRECNEYQSHREFWLEAFKGKIPKLELPIDTPALKQTSWEGGNVGFSIELGVLGSVLNKLKESDIPAFSVLLSVYLIYLYQLTGQEDIVVGTNTSGRMQDELDGVVGMFAKTLPIWYTVNPHITFRDFVTGLHQYFVEAHSRQVYDLIDIISELNRKRSVPIDNLFETMFVFQNFESNILPSEDIKFSNHLLENTTAKYPISLFASEEEDSFSFRFEYSFAYFTKSDIELLSIQFKSLVHRISENLDATIIQYVEGDTQSKEYMDDDIVFKF